MIAIGSDHNGFEMKKQQKKWFEANGIKWTDEGNTALDKDDDYPVYAKKVTDLITSGECKEGILVCGTGIGMSMAANKVKGIRAAVCGDCFSAQATKEHNNANVLCLGARVVGPGLALKIVDTFLETEFSNQERHIRRIDMLEQ